MVTIAPITESSGPETLEAARSLFRAYAAFLRSASACHAFDFKRFDGEILDLPHPYTTANGELLLATVDSKPSGCIAFRATSTSTPPFTTEPSTEPPALPPSAPAGFTAKPSAAGPSTCELKRLFVLPSHRGQGIAENLILAALDHARARGFRSAILDTEPSTMQAANLLYRKLGFIEVHAQPTSPSQGTVFLRKDLV